MGFANLIYIYSDGRGLWLPILAGYGPDYIINVCERRGAETYSFAPAGWRGAESTPVTAV